jgi:hypothetical protein
MKKLFALLVLIFSLACMTFAQSALDFNAPILLTSCGQSADGMSMKILLQRDSLAFDYDLQATVSKLEGKGSLIIVIGGSSKGLGAAKISADDETKRVSELIAAARKAKLPILAVHLGGQARRGALSDGFNLLGAENADHIIVVKGGNDDSFFSTISAEKEIPLEIADTALKVGELVKTIYTK